MEQKVISKNSNQCIYFIQETNLSFYLVIPNSQQVHLVLGLYPQLDSNIFQNFPLLGDKAMIIPVLNPQVIIGIQNANSTYFKYLDEVLSSLINVAYKILTFNHLKVEQKVYLNQNAQFMNFNQWFITKYNGRIEPITIPIFFPKKEESVPTVSSPQVPEQPIEKKQNSEVTTISNPQSTEVQPNTSESISKEENRGKEPGFVSYVLLGVLSAVITLVFLYLII